MGVGREDLEHFEERVECWRVGSWALGKGWWRLVRRGLGTHEHHSTLWWGAVCWPHAPPGGIPVSDTMGAWKGPTTSVGKAGLGPRPVSIQPSRTPFLEARAFIKSSSTRDIKVASVQAAPWHLALLCRYLCRRRKAKETTGPDVD